MAELRQNRVKRKLREGKCVSVVLDTLTADNIDFLGQFGYDGMFIDTEQYPIGWEELVNMSRACDLWGMTPICRVSTNDNSLITRTLDAGPLGIAVPHIRTREDAERAARSIKYPPEGTRGAGFGRQSYGVADYMRKANEETMLVALIEDVEAVENLQSILSVDNIDVFLIGSADLAADLGHAGEFNHPDVIAAIDKCIAEIVAAGKNVAAGTSADNVDKRVDQGVKFLLNTHRPWITRGAREYFAKVAAKLG